MAFGTQRALRTLGGERLGILYKLAILAYLLAVVLFSSWAGQTIFAKGAGLLLAALFLFRAVFGGDKLLIPEEFRFFAAWFILGVITSGLSNDPVVALYRVGTLLQVVPVSLLIVILIYWNGNGRFYWWSVLGCALVSGVVAVANPIEFSTADGRLFGTLANANAFAVLISAGVAISLACIVGTRTILYRVGLIAVAASLLYLVAKTGSRMGMVASLVAVVVVGVCYQLTSSFRNVGRALAIFLLGTSMLAGSLFLFTSSQFADRLEALTEGAAKGDFSTVGDNSLRSRVMLMEKALELAIENPLLGVGLDVFRTADINLRSIGNNSHSNYLEVLASTGLVGAILYFAMYYYWGMRLFRLRFLLKNPVLARRYTLAAAIAAQILVFDLAWVSYYEKLYWILVSGLSAETSLLMAAARSESGRKF